jgi:hypothetical protein
MTMAAANLAADWQAEGYIVVRGLLDVDRARGLERICEPILAQWRQRNPETGEPGGGADATVMRHLNHPGYHLETKDRRQLLEAIADPAVLDVGRQILGEDPLFRCTSLFMNPTQTSQDGNWHRDSQFHHPDEAEEKVTIAAGGSVGHAVQLQVALVPSADVEVVPASHLRWDTPPEYAIRRADEQRNNRSNHMPGAVRVDLQAGDAVAFNPMALHRGRYHADKVRRTLMLTYTASSWQKFDYFSDQPWFDDDGYLDGLGADTVAFFERFRGAYGERWRQQGPSS